MDRRMWTVAFGIGATVLLLATAIIVLNIESITSSSESRTLIGFDYMTAGKHVEVLTQWGPLMTGTDAELRGAEYIQSQFIDAGLTSVHIENYSATLFEVRSTEVCLVPYMPRMNVPRPGGTHITFTHVIDYVVQGYSGSYTWNNFRDDLPVVDIGNGSDPSTYQQARGKLCFIEQNEQTLTNDAMYQVASDAGVKAVVLQNTFLGVGIGYPPLFRIGPDLGGSRFPVIMVSKEAGDKILENPGYKVRIKLDVIVEERLMRVIVGDIKGSSDDIVVFGAHHDTCYNTIGVVDNICGPATLIELARSMVRTGKDFDATMRFASFGGEEFGLFGSDAYYEAHAEEMSNCVAFLNFDMSHIDKRTMVGDLSCTDNATLKGIGPYIDLLKEKDPSLSSYKLVTEYDPLSNALSDYHAFVKGGSIGIAGWGSGCVEYHTYKDDLTHLNAESLQVWARIMGSYAMERWG